MPKYAKGDEVLVRGTVVAVEPGSKPLIKFEGYAYPVPVVDDAVEAVTRKAPRRKD